MTGTICSVAICKSNAQKAKKCNQEIRFFTFPKDKILRKKWVTLCYRKDKFDPSNKRICSKHFDLNQYEDVIHAKLMNILPKKLKETGKIKMLSIKYSIIKISIYLNVAIPSLNLIPLVLPEIELTDRSKRQEIKERKMIVEELLCPDSEIEEFVLNETPITSTESPSDVLEQKLIEISKENELLKTKVSQQESDIASLKEKNANLENIIKENERDIQLKARELLAEFLTPNQVDIVLKKKTKARWTADELSKAFTIRYFSKRAYIYFRKKLKYPLPGISTLQHWAANIDLRRGLLRDILNMMNLYGKNKTDRQRLTVLSFDEIKVSSMIEYDQKLDEIVGPHNYMQVVMSRGLFDSWKQPVFVGFDTKMTASLLDEVIMELNKINYDVVACVSDCGGGNMGLWKELNITIEKTYWLHPITKEKIFVFADIPHMLKLTRNWFLDYGFILEDQKLIKKAPVEFLISQRKTEISSCHKLTSLHITCERSQRQNVTLAAQLMSHTTATALKRYLPGSNKELARNVGDFFDLISKWFDIMNSYTPSAKVITKVPFGRNLQDQMEILNEIKQTFKTMRVISKNCLQIFQKGIIISTTSLQDLYKELSVKHGISYILTHRLNQDCLENLFAQVNNFNQVLTIFHLTKAFLVDSHTRWPTRSSSTT